MDSSVRKAAASNLWMGRRKYPRLLAKSICPVCVGTAQAHATFNERNILGDGMKTRCDYCRGPFGLVRTRYFDRQFCCEECERAYKDQRSEIVAQLKSGMYRSLANGGEG
jgi:hypothetical protein